MKTILNIENLVVFKPTYIRLHLDRIKRSPIGYRLVKGALWSLSGTAISRGMMLVSLIIVARILGKEIFGEFGIIKSTVGMLGVFAGFGLGLTANKHVAEYRDKDPEKAGRILSLSGAVAIFSGGIMGILLFFLGPWLATKTLDSTHLGGLLQIAAILIFFEAINGAQTGALAGFEAFRTIARINFFVGIVTVPTMIGGVYHAGLKGAVWGLIAIRIVNLSLNHFALRKKALSYKISFNISGCLKEYSILFSFSLPAFLSNAMVGPIRWIVNALLVNQPKGYSEFGIYNATYSFQQFLIFFAMTLGAPLLPMISNELNKMNKQLGKVNMLGTWGLGVFTALPLIALPEIIQKLFGKDFDYITFNRTFVLVVLATSIIIYRQGLSRILHANGMMWWALIDNFVWAFFLFLLALFLVKWGAIGLATSMLISYIINTIIFIPLYTRRKLVPNRTIISLEAAIIWTILIIFAFSSLLEVKIYLRIISLPFGFTGAFFAFRKLMK